MAAVPKKIYLEVSQGTLESAKALAMQEKVSVTFHGVWTVLWFKDRSSVSMTSEWAICMDGRKTLPPCEAKIFLERLGIST